MPRGMNGSTNIAPGRGLAGIWIFGRAAVALLGLAVGGAAAGCFDAGKAPTTGGSGGSGATDTDATGTTGAGTGTTASGSATGGTSTTTGPSSTTGDPSGGRVDPANPCPDLPPPPPGAVYVDPSQVSALPGMIASAPPMTTFVLQAGTYELPAGGVYAIVSSPGVVIRGATGDPTDVVLDAQGAVDEVFQIAAPGVAIAELSIVAPRQQAIHVTPPDGMPIEGVQIYDVQARDCGTSCFKANASLDQGSFADNGLVACSRIEMTDDFRAAGNSCANAGAIDLIAVRGWTVRDNWVEGFFCSNSLAFPGVTIHGGSRDVVVERNRVVDCERGIYMGAEILGGPLRAYPDDPCPGKDAALVGGVARNNVVVGKRPELFTAGGFDTGIGLIAACGTKALHNTIASTTGLYASIDARFDATTAVARNNLTTHPTKVRDGATLDGTGNMPNALAGWFVDLPAGDVHLAAGSPPIDMGELLVGDEAVPTDLDGEPRDDGIPDVGADEYRTDG